MILIRNTVRKIKLHIATIKKTIKKMLATVGYSDFDIGLWFTTNKTIQKLNKQYRNQNKPTNILSFPYHSSLTPGKKIKLQHNEDKNLGDIIISLEYAQKEAKDLGQSLEQLITMLLAHGIAHLLGHTHKTDQEKSSMKKIEKKLLKAAKGN